MLTWNVTYRTKPGKREEFFKALTELGVRENSIHEAGNRKYDYFFDAQDPDVLLLVESWDSPEAPAAPLPDGALCPGCRQLKAELCESVTIDKFDH